MTAEKISDTMRTLGNDLPLDIVHYWFNYGGTAEEFLAAVSNIYLTLEYWEKHGRQTDL